MGVTTARPEWTRISPGIPVDTVVRLHGGSQGARQDIQTSRRRVAVVRPGSLQPKPEDEFDATYCYGSGSTNQDMHDRTILPLVCKLIEGYNVCVLLTGATGAGKSSTLEGTRGRETWGTTDGDGLVHLAIDELFGLVHGKAVTVGEAVAQKRRLPGSKGFDFFVESSFVELYNETCRDLYSKSGPAGAPNLPVMEDVTEGPVVTGLSTHVAKNAEELRGWYNSGRANRDTQMMDLGSVHERSTAIFTITLAQYTPAAVHGEEDRVMMSRLMFVDMPGAERLAMDPEVLLLREGVLLNKSLLDFSRVLRQLAQEGSAEFVGYQNSILMQLLSDVLGGNCITLMLGCVRQGDWETSLATLRQLATARRVQNYPLINHSRSRGLLHKLRFRLMSVMEERETLREQLCAVPADADPTNIAINVAKLRDLEARLLQEREEKAALVGEKAALTARLAKLKDAGTDELREKAELQEALVRSEEQRLEISRALIDFQMEHNEAKQEWTNTKYALEQRIMELESGRLEHHVRVEDHASLADERDSLARRLREADDETNRLRNLLDAERQQSTESLTEVRRLNKLLAALEAASAGDSSALLRDPTDPDDGMPSERAGSTAAAATLAASRARSAHQQAQVPSQQANAGKVNLTEVRLQLQRQLKQQERRIAELESQLEESQQQLEGAQSNRTLTQEALDQARTIFKRKMEAAAREVSDLAQRVAVANGEPGHMLAVGPDELLSKVTRYLEEVVQVCQDSVAEARRDADGLSARHTQLRRRCRQLYNGYRGLRYRVEDEWPQGTGAAPIRVVHEDAVIGGSADDILRADDEADRQALVRQQNKVAALEAQLAALKVNLLEVDTLGPTGVGRLSKALNNRKPDNLSGAAVAALQLENSRLREEVDSLKRRLPALGLLRRTSSNMQLAGAATEQLVAEVAQLRVDNERLRAAAAAGRGSAGGAVPGAAVEATGAALHRQVKEFAASTQLDLQRQIKAWEARAVMAEEQLAHLQKYIATASVAYQREIMRLYSALHKFDASVKPPAMPGAAG